MKDLKIDIGDLPKLRFYDKDGKFFVKQKQFYKCLLREEDYFDFCLDNNLNPNNEFLKYERSIEICNYFLEKALKNINKIIKGNEKNTKK